MGQSMPLPVAVDEFMIISSQLADVRTLLSLDTRQRQWSAKLDFVLRDRDVV